ncbi:MAG: tRNA (guanosine(37)-N1)-methyltransferase TrmD [Rhodobacteraceae bacterium]|nr:tRNA (guanosine(37)-N1)-methyltransferase TrmD [Paracoccaceae bacterium]
MTDERKNRATGRKTIRTSAIPRELITPNPDLKDVWKAKVITLFPTAFPGVLGESLTGKALQNGLWQLETINLRDFGVTKHRNVDDTPAGGGAGMVLRADVLGAAIEHAMDGTKGTWPLIYLSPRGKPMTQSLMQDLSHADGITLICGRFEGVDERVLDHYNVQEISLGDFVMTGGEIAAFALIDATVRLIPDVLGNQASTEDESFSAGLLEHPQYTRPADWQGKLIPEVLMSGHHGNVAAWRQAQAQAITRTRRPDLWATYSKANFPIKPDR